MITEPVQANIARLLSVAHTTLNLLRDYSGRPKRERDVDPMLYAILNARFKQPGAPVTRQHPIQMLGSRRLVDFRIGGPNPILLEFAFRPRTGGGDLCSSTNESEILKLSRFPQTEAKLRALLLIDASSSGPYERVQLETKYKDIRTSPGKFDRCPVRVIYAHEKESFHFCWTP
ncbi:hypothetical protein HPC49_25165 [Pyxidicoccus fallax]|uniref:Uncharacterized protein n=1 Tax=Pyxidicoccus fallax TaxID=394095 RepID=A0A848L603_9BACT|nr:hypothetical protein [Pyxidicoccus fallax]NMO14149.1 hypothetical protein [Pyxidicoccus fallax]NPC81506.1 hypothetical protein [Pyxidicoccus fallax]